MVCCVYNLSYCFNVSSTFANERAALIACYDQPQCYKLSSCDIQLLLQILQHRLTSEQLINIVLWRMGDLSHIVSTTGRVYSSFGNCVM